MTESEWSAGLTAHMKTHGYIAFKHADGFSVGVPDHSVTTVPAGTTWLEVKYLRPGQTFRERAFEKKLQFINMLRLGSVSRAFYLMVTPTELHIFHPTGLLQKKARLATPIGQWEMLIGGTGLTFPKSYVPVAQLVNVPREVNLSRWTTEEELEELSNAK